MKPGKNDIRVGVLITGDELTALKEFTGDMCEAFGLDGRFDRYQGKRPIGLYSWDFDCLLNILSCVVKDEPEQSMDHDSWEYQALSRLYERLCRIYEETWHVNCRLD